MFLSGVFQLYCDAFAENDILYIWRFRNLWGFYFNEMKLFFRVIDCLEDAIVNRPVVNPAPEHVVHPPPPKRARRTETTESSTEPTEPHAESVGFHSGQPQSKVQ